MPLHDGGRHHEAIAVTEDLLRRLLGREPPAVRLDSDLEADLGLDSLALMELRQRLEDRLGLHIDEEAAIDARTLEDLLTAAGEQVEDRRVPSPAPAPATERAAGRAAPETCATLLDVLDWHAENHPDALHIRLIEDSGAVTELTYGRLRDDARSAAAGLRANGVRPGDTVALMLPTSLTYFQAFAGAVVAGAVPVPVYPPARLSQLEDHLRRHESILGNAGVRAMVTVPEARQVVRLLRGQVPSLRTVLDPDDLRQDGAGGGPFGERPSAGDTAMLQYTSGSTALPKGVVLTHENLLANVRAMAQVAQITADDVFVSWLPLYHDMGLIGAWLATMTHGVPLVVMSPLAFLSRPVRWLQTVSEHGGTLSASPNFGYELCVTRIRDDDLEGLDLSSWRLAFNGAEPVSPDTLERFSERFAPVGFRREAMTPVYGLAECSVGLTFPPPGRGPWVDAVDREAFTREGDARPAEADAPTRRFVSCGHPLPGHEVRIVDERDQPLGERRQGRIQFRGPSATSGYHRNPEATAALFHGDWLDTGDLGYLAEGELFITGRAKDLIIRAGRNLHPQELEQAVGDLDGVRTGCVAAFAAEDPHTGSERLVIVAETRVGAEEHERLRRRINEAVTAVAGLPPDEVVLAPARAVPKTSSGKIRRGDTRRRWEEGTLHAPADPVWRQVLRLARRAARPEAARVVRDTAGRLHGVWACLVALVVGIPTLVGFLVLPRRLAWRVAHRSLGVVLGLTGIRLRTECADRLPEGPCVLVAPHRSPLDGAALVAALPGQVTFVVVWDLEHIPLLGRLLRAVGVLFIHRDDRAKAVSDVDHVVAAVEGGARVVVFPESTMSTVPGLRGFRSGAFMVGARTGVPVVPVALQGVDSVLHPDQRLPRPGTVRVAVGEPQTAKGSTWEDAMELRDRVRAELLALLDEPDLA